MNKDPNRATERFGSFGEFMDFAYYEAREIHAQAWAINWALYNPDHRIDQDELIERAKQLLHAIEIKAEALFRLLDNWEDLQSAAASSGERS